MFLFFFSQKRPKNNNLINPNDLNQYDAHTPTEGRKRDVSFCCPQFEHLFLLFSPELSFWGTDDSLFPRCSLLLTVSNPLTLPVPLSYFSAFSNSSGRWCPTLSFSLFTHLTSHSLLLIIFSSPPLPPSPRRLSPAPLFRSLALHQQLLFIFI